MNLFRSTTVLSLLVASSAIGLVKPTENIDGKSDLSLAEAEKSAVERRGMGWMGDKLRNLERRDYWIARLIFNLLSYCTVLVPIFLLVKFVKGKKYLEKPANGCYQRLLRLLVEGNNHLSVEEMNSHKSSPSLPENSFLRQSVSLCILGSGLLVSYLIWGVLQERVMVHEYHNGDPNVPGERFSNSQFIVFSNRVLAFLVATTANLLLQQPQHRAPAYKYLYSSFSNIMSSWCQYEALKFVSFPVQVLAKTSKVIPVMLMGKVVSQRSYTCFEYVTASCISLGVFFFLISSDDAIQGHGSSSTTAAGVLILVGYLAFDSFTSNWQDELFTRYKVTSLQMMAGVNFFSVLLTSVSLLEQGTFSLALRFMVRHPVFAFHVFVLSVTSAVGQLFIFATIAKFGPATFTIIMTIRQGLAILLSCIIYGHQVTVAGAFGVAIVFAALFARIYHKQTVAKDRRKKSTTFDAGAGSNGTALEQLSVVVMKP